MQRRSRASKWLRVGIGCDGLNDSGHLAGATENATVVGELLGDLMNRGFDFTVPRLYVLDAAKHCMRR